MKLFIEHCSAAGGESSGARSAADPGDDGARETHGKQRNDDGDGEDNEDNEGRDGKLGTGRYLSDCDVDDGFDEIGDGGEERRDPNDGIIIAMVGLLDTSPNALLISSRYVWVSSELL